jgi:hypothetical protein
MTAKNAPSGATASLTRNSEIAVSRDSLDRWFSTLIALAHRAGATDDGFDLATIACEIATYTCKQPAPIERTLAAIDADIAAIDLLTGELKAQTFRAGLEGDEPYGTKVRNLRRERGKLVLERAELLERRQGISPEDVGVVSLANHDRRNGRSKVVIELDGHRYSTDASKHTVDLLMKNIARAGRFTF